MALVFFFDAFLEYIQCFVIWLNLSVALLLLDAQLCDVACHVLPVH